MFNFSKNRITLFRKITSLLLLLWSFFLTQTNDTVRLFFGEESEVLHTCISQNPFSSSCNWSEYGFGLSLFLYLIIIPLTLFIFFDFSKKYDEDQIAREWQITNKRNIALLCIFGVLFTYYILMSADKWIEQQEIQFDELSDNGELDTLLEEIREEKGR